MNTLRVVMTVLVASVSLTLCSCAKRTNFPETDAQQIGEIVADLLQSSFSEKVVGVASGTLTSADLHSVKLTLLAHETAFSSGVQELIHLKYAKSMEGEDPNMTKGFQKNLYCTVLLRKKGSDWLFRKIYVWNSGERSDLSNDHPQKFGVVLVNPDGKATRYGRPLYEKLEGHTVLAPKGVLPALDTFLFLIESSPVDPLRSLDDCEPLDPLEYYERSKTEGKCVPAI